LLRRVSGDSLLLRHWCARALCDAAHM
jgi:hypothetical protein